MGRTRRIFTKVSVILPTCNRYEALEQNLVTLREQNYPDYEILICDDSHISYVKENRKKINDIQDLSKIRYFYTAKYDSEGVKTYGLATARNCGIVNALGSVLVFLDERIAPLDATLLTVFAEKVLEDHKRKLWLFGDKGADPPKTAFVENCSAVWRQHIIDAGMFNEQINKYGAMTREIYARYSRNGFEFLYWPAAKAMPLCKSRDRERKEKEIDESRDFLKKIGYH